MASIPDNDFLEPYTRYRNNTRNLVMSGVPNQLETIEEKLREHGVPVQLFTEKVNYEALPSLVKDDGTTLQVYLAYVNDFFGTEVMEKAGELREYFTPFDTVDGIFWLGGESSGCPGKTTIKKHGDLVGWYKKLEEEKVGNR